MSALVLIP